MGRVSTWLAVASVIALATALVVASPAQPPHRTSADGGCEGAASLAGSSLAGGGLGDGGAPPEIVAGSVASAGGAPQVPAQVAAADELSSGLGAVNADAGDLPSALPSSVLPPGAPRSVRIGIVLVSYAGLEGAPSNALPRSQAEARARVLLEQARSDFPAAVRAGDPGSVDDVGRMPRGVLEGSLEYAIFTAPRGSVTGPFETPRGFWIVKRLD